jgi:anti-sigma B factor antagonist
MDHERLPSFEAVCDSYDNTARIRACGEVDISNVDRLAASVHEACALGKPTLVFDLHELRYCDSSALHVLVDAARRCASTGTRMTVRGAHGPVRRVLEITDLVDALNVEDG